MEPSFKPPSTHRLRKNLNEQVKYVDFDPLRFNELLNTYECSIASDGWLNTRNRQIINILASSNHGTILFLKSRDESLNTYEWSN